jgi:preprotein translocase subunit SecY
MKAFTEKLRLVFGDPTIRRRILITLGLLVVTRILAIIPIPGIDTAHLQSLFSGNQFLSLLNVFSGGGLSTLSIVMLGVSPYITGSIVMQLLTLMVPKFKAMYQEEGDAGRRRFAQLSRLITIPLALLQGFAFITLFQKQGVLAAVTPAQLIVDLLVITAGSMLLVWIGELISEFGAGNGISLTAPCIPRINNIYTRGYILRCVRHRSRATNPSNLCQTGSRRKCFWWGFYIPSTSC